MTFRKLGVANVFCSQTDACCLDFDTIESTRLDVFVLVDIISWVTVLIMMMNVPYLLNMLEVMTAILFCLFDLFFKYVYFYD